jgi:hypothetical protein
MPLNDEYGLDLPTEDDALTALAAVVGRDMAAGLWELSTRAVGVSRPVRSAADLRRVAEHLMSVGELARVAGRSLKVRVVTYDALSRTVAA